MLCLRVGFLTGSWCSNRGNLALNPIKLIGRIIQEENQEYYECEVADEPVVVSKARRYCQLNNPSTNYAIIF
jgi:hypothetical protein